MAKGWTKLTPEVADKFVKLLEEGHYRKVACAAVGISYQAFLNWLAKGEEGDERYVEFQQRVTAAESKLEIDLLNRIVTHSLEDWRAASFALERRFPTRWGDAKAVQVKLEAERDAMLDALVKALEKRGLADAAEDVFRELAGGSSRTAGGAGSSATAKH